MNSTLPLVILFSVLWSLTTIVTAMATKVSIVTGANGYVGREVVRTLLDQPQNDGNAVVLCLVRPHRIETEMNYWKHSPQIKVLPYDMVDGGKTVEEALKQAQTLSDEEPICMYHVASVFGPTNDPIQTALENVKGTEDVVRCLGSLGGNCRLVLTSSMAAVRGTGQEPLNGKYYTHEDWNTLSQLDATNWGSCYQWSKAESERRAWELAEELDVPMSAICPSFVFGPGEASRPFSVQLVDKWVHGKSPVQSRLCVDVRDVAKAHIEAGIRPNAIGKRFLLTTEARISSQETAQLLKRVCEEEHLGNPDRIHFDSNFQGGSIPIGQKEVDSLDRLDSLLGINLRSVEETIGEMAQTLLHASVR